MGYYTRFSLELAGGSLNDFETEAISRGFSSLNEIIVKELGSYDPFEQECKWYDHDKDMLKISKKHPNALLLLSGEGEESGDFWKTYYRNGKMVRIEPEVVWPVFNETMLK